jgi:GT2 family glycosyltransferase
VGVVIVTYQSAAFIGETLSALAAAPEYPLRVVVVDNGSTDTTEEIVARFDVQWHAMGSNAGYGAAVNEGIRLVGTDVIAVVNPDVTVRSGWLGPLLEALESPEIGAAMPLIELSDAPGRYNTSGGRMTVSAIAWITDHGLPVSEDLRTREVPFPSGAAFVVRRGTWDEIGGMWPDLFLYHEDTDLGWRLRMHGFRSVLVPTSVVAHDYDFSRNPEKLFLLERNRLMLLLANYRRSTLWLLAPVLGLHELGVLWTAVRSRWLGAKLRSWSAVWRLRRALWTRNRQLQEARSIGDAAMMRAFDGETASIDIPGVSVPRGARLVDALTKGWVRMILGSVAWIDRRRGLAGGSRCSTIRR